MKLKLPILLSVILLLILAFSTSKVFAVDTQTISAYPSYSSDADPRSKSWFIYSLPAGVRKDDSVTVVNHAAEAVTLKVYPVDSTTASDGSFALAAQTAPRQDVGSWVTMNVSEVTLGPNESKTIPFTITIPTDATGDHAGGIIFQETTPTHRTVKGMAVNVISRVGVRIYETVPGADQLNMEVRNLHYSVDGNYLTFTFTAEDKGTVHIAPTGMLEVKDMFGRVIDRISLNSYLGVLVPGQPETITVPTQILSPVLGWDTVTVALYYSPTKAAVESIAFMPNPYGAFAVILILLLIIAYLVAKPRLIQYKGKSKKMVPAPHIFIIVGAILLGVIALSGLLSYLLMQLFSGR